LGKRASKVLLMASALFVPLPLYAGVASTPLTVSVVVSRWCEVETNTSESIPRMRLKCADGATRNLRTTGGSYNGDRSEGPPGMATTAVAAPDARHGWRVLTLNF
jgi:hypothetical protein